MTDLSITAANVVAGSNSIQVSGIAGETIAAGKAVYKSSTTNKWMLADSNSATAEARTPDGIALNGASLNQPITVHKSGDLNPGVSVTANTEYFLSDTPGGICPLADVGSGEYLCSIGFATTTSNIAVSIRATGVAN